MVALILLLWPGQAESDLIEFKVNTDGGSSYQGYSSCATALDGRFVVVWEDSRNNGNDIFMQRFDALGDRQSGNSRVNDSLTPAQFAPAVTVDPTGVIWVAWQDYRVSGYPLNSDIFIQRFDSSGQRSGSNFAANDDGSMVTQKEPDIVSNGNEVMVVWSDLRRGQWDIFAQRFDFSGVPLGINFMLNDDPGSAPQHAPEIAVLSDGRFVVVWYDSRSGDQDIYFQIIQPQGGSLAGANIKANTNAGSSRQRFPTVCSGPGSGFTVAWQDFRDGTYPKGSRIYAQLFASDATSASGNLLLVDSESDQGRPRFVADLAGNRVLVWEELDAGTMLTLSRKYPEDADSASAIISVGSDTADGSRTRPRLAIGSGRVFYTWTDLRNGNFDIYMATESYRFPSFLPSPRQISFEVVPRSLDSIAAQIVSVAAIGDVARSVAWVGIPSWLSVTPEVLTTPGDFTFNLVGYSSGDTTFTIWALEAGDSLSSEPVTVRIDVIEPYLSATPPDVTFELNFGQTGAMIVLLSNSQPGPLEWLTIDPEPPWRIDRFAGDSVLVSFDGSGFRAASWSDTLWFIDSLASNSPLGVALEASISGIPAVQPAILALPAEARWVAPYGKSSSSPFVIELSTIPDSAIDWTVTSWPAWLSVDNSTGITPSALVIRPDSDTLALGLYVDTLRLNSPDASNTPLSIPLFLTIDLSTDIGQVDGSHPGLELKIFPNPFNASMLAEWTPIKSGIFSVQIYDVMGRLISESQGTAVRGETAQITWRPDLKAPTGVYFLRLIDAGGVKSGRMLYLK